MSTPYPPQDPQSHPSDPGQAGWQQPHSQPWQAQAPQQGPRFPHGQGYLAMNMLKPSGWGSASMITPLLAIDGHQAPVVWERNVIPVPVGRRHLTAQSTYLWTYGRAELDVDLAPEQTVEVYYAGPLLTFMGGRIGFEPQKRGGVVPLAIVVGFCILVGVAVIIGAVLGS